MEKTTTFRKGQIGKWDDLLDEKGKTLFKNAVNDLLIDLNYETDSDCCEIMVNKKVHIIRISLMVWHCLKLIKIDNSTTKFYL